MSDTLDHLRPEWLDAYNGYMESLDAEFEQYESSIHQDGFGAGYTLGQQAALAAAPPAPASDQEGGRRR